MLSRSFGRCRGAPLNRAVVLRGRLFSVQPTGLARQHARQLPLGPRDVDGGARDVDLHFSRLPKRLINPSSPDLGDDFAVQFFLARPTVGHRPFEVDTIDMPRPPRSFGRSS